MTALLVALGASLGAPLRYLLAARLDTASFPAGTLGVNTAGSLLLGACSGLALQGHLLALLGTGFCGAFTTYSAFAVQVVGAGPRAGAAYAGLTVLLGVAACAAGFALT